MTDRKKLAALKTAVLCGGPGVEREVSLNSGQAVYEALAKAGFSVEKAILPEIGFEKYLRSLDCQVAVMMLHGEFGEDGKPQAILEDRGIAFTGSTAAVCEVAIDKNVSKKLFRRHGVPTADWIIASKGEDVAAKLAAAGIVLPVVVKPNTRGSSVGVTILREPAGLRAALDKVFEIDDVAIVEKFVPGRELTVSWLDGQLLPVIEMVADGTFYDYQAKYLSDKTKYTCPARLGADELARVNAVAENVLKIVSVRDLSRVDIILGPSGPVVLEVNTSPGFTSHSLVPLAAKTAGIDMAELCARLVEMAARRGGLV